MSSLGELVYGILVGAVQGLTEFFPVSSSGHLVLFKKLAASMGFVSGEESLALEIAVHGASLAAICVALWPDILRIVSHERRTILLLIVATIPVGLVGVFLEGPVEALFDSLAAVGGALIVTGLLLIFIETRLRGTATASSMGPVRALLIGCAQAMAVVPGLSRSGCTISAGLGVGLERDQAVRFSFLVAMPAIGGAAFYQVLKVLRGSERFWEGHSWPLFAGAVASSFVFSLLAVVLLLRLVRRHKLSWFALWCIPVGAAALIVHFA